MPPPFHVAYSGTIISQVKKLLAEAKDLGIDKAFRAALARIHHELRNRPLDFGDPSHNLPHAELHIRHEIVRPNFVHWGVHEKSSTVFVKSIELWPGLPQKENP